MTKVAVVLCGNGVYDGSEIYESVVSFMALEDAKVSYQCFAPNIEQMHVINHLTGEVAEGESRNVLVEAARLARGNIKDLKEARVEDFDALLVPGGFGAAKNLSDFAVKGADMQVLPEFLNFAQGMHRAGKPVGLICIAPTMAAKIFGEGVKCTVGSDPEVSAAISSMGAEHLECTVEQTCVDAERKLVTTPAYMLANTISEAAKGIRAAIDELLKML